MNVLDELTAFGFRFVTEWVLKANRIRPASLSWGDHSGWLYAFVGDGGVKYIGLTTRVLRSRLDNYCYNNASQCARLRTLITEQLVAGNVVRIFGWTERDETVLIAEEQRLRATYRPPWNRM